VKGINNQETLGIHTEQGVKLWVLRPDKKTYNRPSSHLLFFFTLPPFFGTLHFVLRDVEWKRGAKGGEGSRDKHGKEEKMVKANAGEKMRCVEGGSCINNK